MPFPRDLVEITSSTTTKSGTHDPRSSLKPGIPMTTSRARVKQLAMPMLHSSEVVDHFAALGREERGAVFTRGEVVDFILDLAGYTTDHPLYECRLLEPAIGNGDFLLSAVDRLLTSYDTRTAERSDIVTDLSPAIRAIEVHRSSIKHARLALSELLEEHGIPSKDAQALMTAWIIQADFLLVDLPHAFTHIVGNPPYVRQELIPDWLMAEYRARYSTIYDRADLYIPFIERSLEVLAPEGVMGFICADRWMKNKYGSLLRAMVADQYHLVCYVDMTDTPAFQSQVIAYPAITVIKREKPGRTRVAHRPLIDRATLTRLARTLTDDAVPSGGDVVEVERITNGSEPWLLQSLDQLELVRRLEADFPCLEETRCTVGIGVATGADRVFIGPFESLDVEENRKLRLVRTKDITDGTVRWLGFGVINPFNEDGSLVDLVNYPRFSRYLEKHGDIIRARNCAKRNPSGWYRTIDRIDPRLAGRPKLLIPDIKGEAHIVLEAGHLYPHHNLYFITSEEWDLKALQAVLRSGIAKLFVSAYSTRMRGGYLRFQAQYLRRIRLPHWRDVPENVRAALIESTDAGDTDAANDATFVLYGLTPRERAAVGGHSDQSVQ